MITCMLQATLCDTGIPCTFYGENVCSVEKVTNTVQRAALDNLCTLLCPYVKIENNL